ncbi:hypothetical protein P7C70_g5435, partial [Phenoliferia sp. Uapishka_3]
MATFPPPPIPRPVTMPADTPTFIVEVPVTPPSLSLIPFPLTDVVPTQPINLIHAEILAVVSAMRKNQRWAPTSSTSFTPYPFPTTNQPSLGLAGVTLRTGGGGKDAGGKQRDAGSNAGLMSGFMSLKMELRNVEGPSLSASPRFPQLTRALQLPRHEPTRCRTPPLSLPLSHSIPRNLRSNNSSRLILHR